MFKKIRITIVAALLVLGCALGGVYSVLPDTLSVASGGDIAATVCRRLEVPAVTATVNGNSATVKLLGLLPVKSLALNIINTDTLYVGGTPFGVKFFTKGVLVVGLTDVVGFSGTVCPARDAGIEKGDVVLTVNGEAPTGATNFRDIVSVSGGEGLVLEIERDGKTFTTTLYPALCGEDNSYRAGLWVRDSTAGIGTVTYINAKDNSFAGLGHGICDGETGTLMPLGRAVVVDVDITGVRKGAPSAPGELKGSFGKVQQGTIDRNTETGVYGTLTTLPENLGTPMPIGYKEQLKEGKAFIYTTLSGTTPEKYSIEIEKIYKDSDNTKNFLIKVTDPRLLEVTGGIVQGMSGSPIIQNGRLVGAVTHVLVNDPTHGYGIYIENMLSSGDGM